MLVCTTHTWGLGFRVQGVRFKLQGLEIRLCWVQGIGCVVYDLVELLGFRV